MEEADYKTFIEMLENLAPSRQIVFLSAMQLFMDCCKQESELSAVLIVRKNMDGGEEYALNVAALNADIDDAYEILTNACSKVAEDIKEGAPAREYYN